MSRGVLPEKLQTLTLFTTKFAIFPTLFMTLPEKVTTSKNHTQPARPERKNHNLYLRPRWPNRYPI